MLNRGHFSVLPPVSNNIATLPFFFLMCEVAWQLVHAFFVQATMVSKTANSQSHHQLFMFQYNYNMMQNSVLMYNGPSNNHHYHILPFIERLFCDKPYVKNYTCII